MNSKRWKQINKVLNAALDLPVSERSDYLDEHCPDSQIRQEVEELMAAHEEAGSFLETPAASETTSASNEEFEAEADPLIGEEIDGYQIEEVLGRGGMGVVYGAEDVALSRRVALKRVNPGMAEDASLMRRFRSEARALARIDSPHIVRIYALRPTDQGLFIVMEHVEGGTLADPMEKGAMEEEEAARVFRQMLLALRDAHRAEVIHRDIKPQNIMLTRDGRVKVTDFGLARLQQRDKQVTVTQTIAGTLNYMSPEQVKDPSQLDHRSDLYSLGMTFYEMLTGQLPFEEDSNDFEQMQAIVAADFPAPSTYRSAVPAALDELVVRAIQRDPDDRFQSAEAMLEALDDYEMTEADAAVSEEVAEEGDLGAEKEKEASPSSAMPYADSWVGRVGLAILMFAILNAGRYAWVEYTAPGGNPRVSQSASTVTPSTLSVSSDPADADIFLNDRLIGQTPLSDYSDYDVEGESITVRVQKSGFAARDTMLHTTPGQPIALEMALVRAEEPSPSDSPAVDTNEPSVTQASSEEIASPSSSSESDEPEPALATLNLGIEPSGTISVDGDRRSGSGTVRVPAGRQTIRFDHPEYDAVDTTLSLQAGREQSLTCYFEHTISVGTKGQVWASTWVNGELIDQGGTTLTRGPGTYRIEARRTGYEVTGGAHRIKVGGQTRSERTFEGNARTITVAPSFQKKEHFLAFELQ